MRLFFLVALFLLLTWKAQAQVQVSSTGGNNGPVVYSTLKEAFDVINSGVHTATITIEISGDCVEPLSAILNASGMGDASYSSIHLSPAEGAAVSISGNIAGPLVDLNGADQVIIDGDNGDGSGLLFENSSTSATASVIRLIGDASFNTIQNCTIKGASGGANSGSLFFSTGILTGNDNNIIAHNLITSSGTNFAVHAIYAAGTSESVANSSITIDSNLIADYFHPSITSNGIHIAAVGNTNWTISNNRLYQTAERIYIPVGTLDLNGIQILGGEQYTITGNCIGFSNPEGTGTTDLISSNSNNPIQITGSFPESFTFTGNSAFLRYSAISMAFKAGGIASSIQNNLIGGFAMLTAMYPSSSGGSWCGIFVSSGNVNIGTQSGNVIGDSVSTGAVYLVTTATGASVVGIYVSTENSGTIRNNLIGGIESVGHSNTISGSFVGIDVYGAAGIFSVSHNTIGNETPENIRTGYTLSGSNLSNMGVMTAASGSANITGIRSSAGGLTLTISNNVIRGLATSGSETSITGINSAGTIDNAVVIDSNDLGTVTLGWVTYSIASGYALVGIRIAGSTQATYHSIQHNFFTGISDVVNSTSGHTYILTTAGIAANNVTRICHNTFHQLETKTKGGGTFISHNYSIASTGVLYIEYNLVDGGYTNTGGGSTSSVIFTYSIASSAAGSICSISYNDISYLSVAGTTTLTGIYNADGFAPKHIAVGNLFTHWTAGTGLVEVISISTTGALGKLISNNIISNITCQGNVIGINCPNGYGEGPIEVSYNRIDSIASSNPGGEIIGITNSGFNNVVNVKHNLVSYLSTASNTLRVIGIATTNVDSTMVSDNSISHLSGSGITSTSLIGIYVQSPGHAVLLRNKIFELTQTGTFSPAAPVISGVLISAAVKTTMINNLIGNLYAPHTSSVDAIRGINVTSTFFTGAYYFYHNTVYIDSSSTGTNFGSSGIFHIGQTSATRSTIYLKNNIIINNSVPNGTGKIVALRNSNNNFANYVPASNTNDFYAGPETSSRFIYYSGTTGYHMSAFQTHVNPRESASVFELVSFIDTVGESPFYLHINADIDYAIENHGTPLPGITTDFDLDNRDEFNPDIGADEFGACTNIITNANDTGIGSLRDRIACSLSGTTLYFDNSLTDDTVTLTTGDILIDKNLRIIGPGKNNLTLSGNNASRIFHIQPGNLFELSSLSMKDANSAINGGALWVQGMLILQDILLENNFENDLPKTLTIEPGSNLQIDGVVECKY
ncbi:MAG TPA: hypothetical protein VGK46_08800 [Saprospiraceae bacterium]